MGPDDRKASSQSLPLHSVLVNGENRKKISTRSEGSGSRRVSFIDELTGKSARPEPDLERNLSIQLEQIRESGEMGEFMSNDHVLQTRLASIDTIEEDDEEEQDKNNKNNNERKKSTN